MMLAVLTLSTYLICGLFWVRLNRKKPPHRQIMASNAVILLLWPLGFFHAHLQPYWAKNRFTISAFDPPKTGIASLGLVPKLAHTRIDVRTLKEALSRAENLAASTNENVSIADSAKYDKNFLGEYWNRICFAVFAQKKLMSAGYTGPSRIGAEQPSLMIP